MTLLDWLAANWTEVLGFATGAVCVVLAVRRNVWNYPIGIANNLVFILLFITAGLYADSGLQVVFAVLAVHGWIRWTRGQERDLGYVGSTPRRAVPLLVAAGAALTGGLSWLLVSFTDSTVPLADAATTAVSLVAQYMLNRKWIQTWWVWFSVDLAYIALYLVKGLTLTAVLYAGFAALCVTGFLSWRKLAAKADSTPEAVHV